MTQLQDPPEPRLREPLTFLTVMFSVSIPFGLIGGVAYWLEPKPRPYELVLTERGCEVLASRDVPTTRMELGMCRVAPERIIEGDCRGGYLIQSPDQAVRLRLAATEIVSRIEL